MSEMKNRLKEMRKALNLRQREVADKLRIHTGMVGNWESGVHVPVTRVYQICNEFGVRREWLEEGKGEMFEPEKAPKSPEELRLEVARGFLRECSDDFKRALFAALREDSSVSDED